MRPKVRLSIVMVDPGGWCVKPDHLGCHHWHGYHCALGFKPRPVAGDPWYGWQAVKRDPACKAAESAS